MAYFALIISEVQEKKEKYLSRFRECVIIPKLIFKITSDIKVSVSKNLI